MMSFLEIHRTKTENKGPVTEILELTISSDQTVVFALNFVQYLTCKVPELRPGKKSAICFQVRFFVSFSSTAVHRLRG